MADIIFPLRHKRVWVAGETGMVGRALCRSLQKIECEILSAPHNALDLTDQTATRDWLAEHKPDAVFMAAGRVGGIGANQNNPAAFLFENLAMAQNVIDGAWRAGVKKLLYLGSSCIYPKEAAQPITPDALLSGPLEPTNASYALAKIAGIKLCKSYRVQYGCDFIAAMPTNLYGPDDRFDPENGHVIAAMLIKFHQAKLQAAPQVTLWGTGTPLREFLHVDDLAAALIMMMERYSDAEIVNIGSGEEISISDLAHLIRDVTGYQGDIVFDAEYPDGVMRKYLDTSIAFAMGWKATTMLEKGMSEVYLKNFNR